jgi:pimeloyl-ACP methyl ester carboxylesterase
MTTFVLVPGFWLGAWAWDAVAAPLRAAGHEVVAVTPPGLAERAADGPGTTAEDHVADVVARLRELPEPAVLVGHSGAGPVVAAAAERAREKVAQLVFVDTGPLPDAMAFIDFADPAAREWITAQLAANDGWYPMPGPARLAELGTSTAGLDDRALGLLAARATPEPGGVVTGAVRRGTADPELGKVVVACSFTAEQVRGLVAAGVPGFAEMGGAEWSIRELLTGHWPMLSEPAALAAVLVDISG